MNARADSERAAMSSNTISSAGKTVITLDEARGYLSVKIPVHPIFIPKVKARSSAYDAKILSILEKKPLNLTDLSKEMGYKGITQKLRKAVEALCVTGFIEKNTV